jgi:membrane protein implicated in regulation of membrane protease activity
MVERAGSGGWRVTAGFVAILALAGGWFLLSWGVQHTAVTDALGEAAGVAFALLVVVSAVGSVLGARKRGDEPTD